MAKVYTAKGDFGTTQLRDKTTVPKDHPRIAACGVIDELNSAIGLVLSEPNIQTQARQTLTRIQHELFDIGEELSSPKAHIIPESYIHQAEQEIDKLEELIPPLNKFILPTGNYAAASCHLARAICRRAERKIVALSHKYSVNPVTLKYINRLSDLLFMIARILAG